jgi:hypothetical protein
MPKWAEKAFLNQQLGMKSNTKFDIDNEVRVVNFTTPENLIAKSTMLPHHNIHNYNIVFRHPVTHFTIILCNTVFHVTLVRQS